MDQNPVNLTPEELENQNLDSQKEVQVEETAAMDETTVTAEETKNTKEASAPAEPTATADTDAQTNTEQSESHQVDTKSMSAEELLKYLGECVDAEELPRTTDMRRLQNLVEKGVRESSSEAKDENEAETSSAEALQIAFINLKARYQELRAKQKEEEKNEREDNLAQKERLINELEALLTSTGDFFTIRNERANIINKWREIGAVPENKRTALLNHYAKVNEAFYEQNKLGDDEMVEDYRQNRLEKEALIVKAKELANEKNARKATRILRELQDQWKETGPVAPEFKDAMWKEFKDAASVINKKQEEYNEEVRRQQQEALEKKRGIVDELETLLIKIPSTPREWQKMERNINRIKDDWRNAGRVSREDRWEVDSRYRVAMDEFYHQRRTYSKAISEESGPRVERMKELLEQATEYKTSEDWHDASSWFKETQKEWEELRDAGIPFGTDRRLNRSFRRAADQFFGRMREHYSELRASREDNFAKKMDLVERLRAVWESKPEDLAEQMAAFEQEWQGIGPVPDKKKDDVLGPYYGIMRAYRGGGERRRRSSEGRQGERREGTARRQGGNRRDDFRPRGKRGGVAWSTEQQTEGGAPVDFSRDLGTMTTEQLQKERNDLKWNIKRLQSQLLQYETNIGFFQSSSTNDPVVQHVQKKIDAIQKDIDKHEKRLDDLKEAIKTSSDQPETDTTDTTNNEGAEQTDTMKDEKEKMQSPATDQIDDTDKVETEKEDLLEETETPDGEEANVGSLKPENPLPEAQEPEEKEEEK